MKAAVMLSTLRGLGRLLAISALGLLLAVLLPLIFLASRFVGCGLWIAEPLKAKLDELWSEVVRHG